MPPIAIDAVFVTLLSANHRTFSVDLVLSDRPFTPNCSSLLLTSHSQVCLLNSNSDTFALAKRVSWYIAFCSRRHPTRCTRLPTYQVHLKSFDVERSFLFSTATSATIRIHRQHTTQRTLRHPRASGPQQHHRPSLANWNRFICLPQPGDCATARFDTS